MRMRLVDRCQFLHVPLLPAPVVLQVPVFHQNEGDYHEYDAPGEKQVITALLYNG
jgi:hypothetical protein